MSNPLRLALADTLAESGWGVCSRYLDQELSKLTKIDNLQKRKAHGRIPGTILHAVDGAFGKTMPSVDGHFDAAYCFFEHYLTPDALDNARIFDLILTGSTWCTDVLRGHGFSNVETLIQGIDPKVWNRIDSPKDAKWRDWFVIYSGGKFEMRKGQDLVLKAVKILQQKYKDIVLVNTWENKWESSYETMAASPYIVFRNHGETWEEKINALYAMNHMYMGRLYTYPLLSQRDLRNVIRNSDLGLFPNRCEGGTNLALMEYMATGKPVVATMTSGHRDILTDDNCFPVKDLHPTEFMANGKAIAMWDEPNLDEIISQVEFAYNNREAAEKVGREGAKSLRRFTWEQTARDSLRILTNASEGKPEVFKPRIREEFPEYLNALGLIGNGVEVGVQAGWFSHIIRKSWNGKILHLVDRWKEQPGYEDMANIPQTEQDELFESVCKLFRFDSTVNIVRLDSSDAAKLYPDGYFDFVYLDADHSKDGIERDLEAWWPKVRAGGVLSGHDFLDGEVYEDGFVGDFGVQSTVTDFAQREGLQLYLTREDNYKSWWVRG